ncbi:MAG: response regulator [Bacteroidales bacterium]|nr:response regulator [Bacteroidales bacterium]
MKKVIVVGIPDKHLQDLINNIENHKDCNLVKKMYTSFQLSKEYKNGDADVIFLDSSIPDGNMLNIAEKLRGVDPNVFIVGVSLHKDPFLIQKFKESIMNTDFILKIDDNKKNIERLLESKSMELGAIKAQSNVKFSEKTAGKVVMVVDDFENTLNIVKYSLEQAGFSVITALSGLEAIQQLEKHVRPDVIITDLNMPNMNGFELIEEIRKYSFLDTVPIFILTTEFNLAKKIQAKQLKITGWIQKPYDIKEFTNIIINAL